jgi:thioredoxin 1
MLESISTKEQFSDILNKHKMVLLKFGAPWCGPCRILAPKIEKLSEANPEVKFFEVDADSSSELVQQFKVSALPTVIVFRSDKVISRIEGANMKKIEEAVKDVQWEN